MAYVTGTAASFSDLLTALQNACAANGYTVSAGGVIYKGTLYAEVKYVSQTYPCLRVQGGTGVDGSGNLTGRSDAIASQLGIVTTGSSLGSNGFTFPVSYEVFIGTNPDEVYLVVNLNTNQYQYIAFGQSNVAGLTGTGNWYAGSDVQSNRALIGMDVRTSGGFMQQANLNAGFFQGLSSNYPSSMNGAVHHALDGTTGWGLTNGNTHGAWPDLFWQWNYQPNAWNSEAALLPVTVYAGRPSDYISCVLELAHARFIRIDNLSDGQIITLGTDKWKVYPWWKRSNEGTTSQHYGTGVNGHAFRYDGP